MNELFHVLDKFQKISDEIHIFLDSLEDTSYIQIYLGTVIGLKVGLYQYKSVSEQSSDLNSRFSEPRYLINFFSVGKSHLPYNYKDSSILEISQPVQNNSFGNRIYELIQSQIDSKWADILISHELQVYSLEKILHWFSSFKSLFTSPCDSCLSILIFEPKVGQMIPPLIRIEHPENKSGSGKETYCLHPACVA
ncbi:hypothetical protein AYI68_g1373 [Smittium mucronatum]|uniref:Uncharacterized protein n=1 Tax=Smittium mucronatum TaxID=133383 RepID=A0A1R0H5H5_9FUNG|nr:hypothetical protein AYI68_g1373 [Smittium mucronatum]